MYQVENVSMEEEHWGAVIVYIVIVCIVTLPVMKYHETKQVHVFSSLVPGSPPALYIYCTTFDSHEKFGGVNFIM